MGAEDNARTARQCYELFEKNEIERAASYAAPDATWEMIPTQETYRGPAGFAECLRNLKTAYPDLKVRVENQIASENLVACELLCTGTHKGTMKSPRGEIPATGKRIETRVFEIWEFQHGKVRRLRSYYDTMGMMQQLGQMGKAA